MSRPKLVATVPVAAWNKQLCKVVDDMEEMQEWLMAMQFQLNGLLGELKASAKPTAAVKLKIVPELSSDRG